MIKIKVNQETIVFKDNFNLKFDSRYLSIKDEDFSDLDIVKKEEIKNPKLTIPFCIRKVFQSKKDFKIQIFKDKNNLTKICANLI